jgi:hypothetical protein
MSRNNEPRKRKGKKVYSLIVDGETEIWYFQLMKQYESFKNFDIKPELPKKKKLSEMFKLVESHVQDYSEVFWIIDFDTILKETNETKEGEKTKIQELNEYIEKLKIYQNVKVLINTPCLEFWYLLHFKETGKFYHNCEPICKELDNTILKGYLKTEKYYKKKDNDIYSRLLPYQQTAIINAEKLGDYNIGDPFKAKAEIYKLMKMKLKKNSI